MGGKSKKLKVVVVSIILFVLLSVFTPRALLTTFKVPTAAAASNASTVKLDKKSLTLEIGKIYRFTITGTTKKVNWKSSNTTIAMVTKYGTVKGLSVGTSTITATVDNKEYKCKVTVKAPFVDENVIVWKDPAFEAIVRLTLGKATGDITKKEAENYTDWLVLYRNDVKTIDDIVWFKNIVGVYVRADLLKDVSILPPDIYVNIFFNGIKYFSDIDKYCNIKEINKISWLEIILSSNDNRGYFVGETYVKLSFENDLEDFSNVDFLLKFQNLHSLRLSGYQIPNISSLDCLTKIKTLTELDLSSNNISDISILKDLIGLRYLDLDFNLIEDISCLSELKNLGYVNLRGNKLSDISVLGKLYGLHWIDASENSIKDISSLSELNLMYLYLSFNEIEDIKSIENMSNLLFLDLSHNLISDISSLKCIKESTPVYLYINRITDWSPVSHITTVQGRPN